MAEGKRRGSRNTWAIGHVEDDLVLKQFGPWTHEAQISTQNVIKLRKLIQLQLAQQSAQSGDAAIAIFCQTRSATFICFDSHTAEFVNGKQAAVTTHAFLDKDRRAPRCKPDAKGNHQHRRGKYDEYWKRNCKIEEPLRAREAPLTHSKSLDRSYTSYLWKLLNPRRLSLVPLILVSADNPGLFLSSCLRRL